MNFDVKTEKLSDGQYVISLSGEVDLYTAPEFKQQLLEVIEQGGRDVIVDLSNTTFIDSTTLGVLVGGVKRLRTNEGQLSLVCSDRNITKIFEITGLDRVFAIHPTLEARPRHGICRLGAVARAGRCLRGPDRGDRRDRLRHHRSPRGRLRRRDAGQGALQGECGQCHTLADAGTKGVIGPNLDDAFPSRGRTGSATDIQSVVRDQIAYPVEHPTTGSPGCPPTSSPATMRTRWRLYVASVAALPVRRQPEAGAAPRAAAARRRHRTARRSSPRPAAAAATRSTRRARPGTSAPTSTTRSRPKELVIDRVTNGKGVMPSFKD